MRCATRRTGYALQLEIGGERHEVSGDDRACLYFRTIEHVLDLLIDAPELASVPRLESNLI